MKGPLIVGFTGKKGCGKDTAADYLVSFFGFTRIAFADPLKDSVAGTFGITRSNIEAWKNDPNIHVVIEDKRAPWDHLEQLTFRQYLQRFGTEGGRDVFGDNFWINQALSQAKPGGRYVISDCRFENEIRAIRELDPEGQRIIIHISRLDLEDSNDTHASEEDHSELADSCILNVGSYNAFYDEIEIALREYQVYPDEQKLVYQESEAYRIRRS